MIGSKFRITQCFVFYSKNFIGLFNRVMRAINKNLHIIILKYREYENEF